MCSFILYDAEVTVIHTNINNWIGQSQPVDQRPVKNQRKKPWPNTVQVPAGGGAAPCRLVRWAVNLAHPLSGAELKSWEIERTPYVGPWGIA
ncbi:MAG: hypothetical protein ACR2Q4_17305 [Geminicoccaceae bacterium]